jgi:3-oxoacyl-[acyl-carrier protein] reductase
MASQLDVHLTGKTALVCGASQGIGEATARVFAAMGANVILLSRTESKLQEVAKSLAHPERHQILALDVHDRKTLEAKLNSVLLKSPIEILVCNTGGPKGGPIVDAQEDQFLEAFENHILANHLMVRLCLPGMKARGYGRIINIISTSVKVPLPNLGVSNTIRAAVASWAKTLSLEIASSGITVNNVLPGYTLTPRLHSLMQAAATKSGGSLEATSEQWRKTVPMGRFADPSEVANAVAFFASPAASYITGTSLAVDGGRTGAL